MNIFLRLALLSVFLVGCSSSSCKRTEATVCKSCKPYFVRGSWHYPQTYYEYEEEGLASWYGPGFAGKPKPYGEPFNPNALTAAHRTLPLPSVVEVTNLDTGVNAVILIDDRGPFTYEGRIIDLSVESAKAVGLYSKGVGRVRVRSLVEESKALSQYLTRYGKSARDKVGGRTWRQILDQEILCRYYACYSQKQKIETESKGCKLALINEELYLPVGMRFQTLEGVKVFASRLICSKKVRQKWMKKIVKQCEKGKSFYVVKVGPFKDLKEGEAIITQISLGR